MALKYEYKVLIYRNEDPLSELVASVRHKPENRISVGQSFGVENYWVRAVEMTTQGLGGDPTPARLGVLKAVLLRDDWKEFQEQVKAEQEAKKKAAEIAAQKSPAA